MTFHHFAGSGEYTLIVTVPPESAPEAGGDVEIEIKSGDRFMVSLDPRFFRVLRIIIEVAVLERELRVKSRGARSRAKIARLYSNQVGDLAIVDEDCITSYVFKIRKAVKEILDELVAKGLIAPTPSYPQVSETIRHRGYRLGDIALLYVDHTHDEA
jgi:hypothetical protein